MYLYTIRQWLLFFYAYCFFGWIFESTYVSLKQKHFTNRGFMKGPFLPIYGTGAILGLFVTIPVRGNYVLMYIFGALAATVLEYFTGVWMERIFKVRYWDYSYKKIQYKGHICLSSAIAWGFMIIFLVEVIHRPIEKLIIYIEGLADGKFSEVLVYALTIYFAADAAIAFHEAIELREVLVYLEKARGEAEYFKDKVEEKFTTVENAFTRAEDKVIRKAENLKEKGGMAAEHMLEKKQEFDSRLEFYRNNLSERTIRMLKRFYTNNPTAVSAHFKNTFAELKENLKRSLTSR